MPTNLTKILKFSLQDKGIDKSVAAYQICRLYNQEIVRLAGSKAGINSQALFFKNKTLFVRVNSSSWACELGLKRKDIIDFINQKQKEKIIERIVFKIE